MIDEMLQKYKKLSSDKLFEKDMLNMAKENILEYYNINRNEFIEDFCEPSNLSLELENFSISKSYLSDEYCFVLYFGIYENIENIYRGGYKLVLDINLSHVDDSMCK